MPDTAIPPHIEYPRIRPVEVTPIEQDGQIVPCIHDIAMLSDQICIVTEPVIALCQNFNGSNSLSAIAEATTVDFDLLQQLVEHLDQAHLLEGPTFETYLESLKNQFDTTDRIPIRAGADITVENLHTALMESQSQSTGETLGLIVPHIDFRRGEKTYAAGYHLLQSQPVPNHIIVLGTNHHGRSTGVVMSPKGYETTIGPLEPDLELIDMMTDRLGPALTEHRLDHAREHSVELQMPWIRHLFGNIPVTGFLVHDPLLKDGESYDGRGIGLDAFVNTLRETIDAMDGRTLIICGADLSHIGKQFGDDQSNTPERCHQIEELDRRHLQMIVDDQLDLFHRSMKVLENPTRWCTIGAMTALCRLLPNTNRRLIKYDQSKDDPTDGECCVTMAAISFDKRSDES